MARLNGYKRVALVGAGGTGKSTILEKFKAKGFKVFPSITRAYYAQQGIKDEEYYFNLTVPEKIKFQHGMRDYYKAEYAEFISAYPEHNTIADRSLLDHVAYGIHGLGGPEGLTLDDIIKIKAQTLCYCNCGVYTHFIYFPYPQGWMLNTSIDDGFRYTDSVKNFTVASLMLHLLVYPKVVDQELNPELLMIPDCGWDSDETFRQICMNLKILEGDPKRNDFADSLLPLLQGYKKGF